MSKFTKNISWIFIGNAAHAVLQFALNVYCARQFGSENFGLLNYSTSLIAFFTAIGTLGFNGVITKYFADNEEKSGSYLGTTIISRIFFSIISIILLQGIICFDSAYTKTLAVIILCQSMQILFGSADLFVYWFRYKNQAKEVAILRLLGFFIAAIWRFVAISFKSLEWYSLGVSLEFLLFSGLLFYLYKAKYKDLSLEFDRKVLGNIIKMSYPFIFSSILVTVYGQTDKIMLKSMLDFSSVGIYSVSLTLAGAIAVVPAALIEGFRPEIMIFKNQDENKYRFRLQQLYGIVFWLCVSYCLFITIFSRQIILFLYGEQYLGAVNSLAVILWYNSFSYFGAINAMYMVAENKTFWIQICTFVGAVINILLNLALIPVLGIVGAALASLLTQIIANYFMLWFIKPLRPCFNILNEGIILKPFMLYFKKIK